METEKLICFYVAFLRSLYLLHQNNHWLSQGASFYSGHLLFERLYQSAAENSDEAAEKMIGLFGSKVVLSHNQVECIKNILDKYKTKSLEQSELVKISLKAEEDFLDLSIKIYDLLEKEDKMTLGLDDMILSIANKREEAVYLLQQTLKG